MYDWEIFRIDHRSSCWPMQCTNCHHQIEDPEALFCAQCGQSLCREGHCCCCGKRLPRKANFCDRCGAPVTANPPLPNVPVAPLFKETLRQVTPLKGIIQAEVRHHVEQAQVKRSIERAIQREKAHQAMLLKYGLCESDWIGITGGTFIMGSPPYEKDRFENEHQHEVHIGRFEMLKTPVTFAMFDIFCDEVRRNRPRDENWGRGNRRSSMLLTGRPWTTATGCQTRPVPISACRPRPNGNMPVVLEPTPHSGPERVFHPGKQTLMQTILIAGVTRVHLEARRHR